MKHQRVIKGAYLHEGAAASTALTTLKGLIEGISCDTEINDLERIEVLRWIEEFDFLKTHPAVGSVFDYLAEALADNVLSLQEADDIKWMIEKNLVSYYDETTQKIQSLLGLLSGIAADDEIKAAEFAHLWMWLNDNEDLKGVFPYDEIYSIVCQVGTKRAISAEQKKFLLTAFKFTQQDSALLNSPLFPWEIDPDINVKDRTFCITGISKRGSRSEIESAILQRSGLIKSGVSQKLNYLVVCAEPNRAWTHACYGRKIEQAIMLRRAGHKLAIVSEADFWDAIRG